MPLPKGTWGVSYTVEVPLIKRGVVDFAVSADYTPASGDVKVFKDGGAAASITTLPSAVTSGNGATWQWSLSATEMQCTSRIAVVLVDAATKAVEDQSFVVEIDYGLRSGTAQAGASSTITLDASASAVDNFYTDTVIEIVGGTGAGQKRLILGYVGSTKVATVAKAWATTPDSTSIFRIKECGAADARAVGGTVQTARDLGADTANIGSPQQVGTKYPVTLAIADASGLAPSATALSNATWTSSLATNLGTLAGHDPGGTLATSANQTTINNNVVALGAPMQAGAAVALATSQPNYAPAKAGDAMALTSGERTTLATAILTDTTSGDFAVAGSLGHVIVTQLGGAFTTTSSSVFTTAALANAPSGGGGSDQWATAEPGSYAAGTFGYLVANALTSTTSWIFAASSYTAPAVPAAISQARSIGNEPYTKTFTQNDLRTGIGDQLIDAQTGSPINLTGSTATFRMISQTDKSVKINDVAATFTDAPNGKVAYSWTGTDLDTPGLYWGWWIVTTGGKTEHFPGDGEKMTVKVVTAE